MKYRFCYCFTICILSIICLFCGCKSDTSAPLPSNTPDTLPSGELSVAELFNIVKDYDYWDLSFDGNVTALNGDEEISLQCEKGICSVEFIDGWIYYVKSYNGYCNDFDILRIRPNGEDSSVVLNSAKLGNESGSSFHSFAFVDGYMYVQMGFEFYRYNLQSGEITELGGDISTYKIIDNQLYFICYAKKDFTIYVMNLETKETEILLGDGVYARDKNPPELIYSNFIFIGDVMYYTKRFIRSDNEFYLVEIFRYENGESKLIDNKPDIDEYSLSEHDGKLYYIVKNGKTGRLNEYNPKNEKVTEVVTCDDYSDGSTIKNGYFYYQNSEGKIKRMIMKTAF